MSIEAHLISFYGDLYGQTLRLFFIDRIRPEQRFDGIDALKSQLHHDIDETLSLLQKQKEVVENTYRLWG